MPNVHNVQELEEYSRQIAKGLDTLELVSLEELVRRTGWDHAKNIGAIMVSSPPRTKKGNSICQND